MMRSPFHRHYTQEQIDAAYATDGWGTKVQRRVPRPAGGEPLYFQFRLPNDVRCIEVAELVAAARDTAPAMLQGQAATLAQAADAAGMFVVAAITPENDPSDILMTIAGALASLDGDPPLERLDEPAGWDVIHHEFERVSKEMTCDDMLVATKTWGPNHDTEFAMQVEQYLVSSQYGAVALTFTSSHAGMMSGDGWKFCRNVMKSVWLGETSDPPQ
jgi:hypothetical protein